MNGVELRRIDNPQVVEGLPVDDLETARKASQGRRLLCRACGNAITRDGERMAVEGRHIHRRTNPAGLEFELGCFGKAPGAAALGEPTTEHSWFGGYAWCFDLCRGCGTHLGWYFDGSEPPFHGLILNRLQLEDDVPQ